MLKNLKSLTDIANIASGAKQHILSVPLGDVVSKEQVRKKFKNIDELAESMKVEGQQTPILVSPKNQDGKYVIQKGERRWRALNVAGIKTIDVIVRPSPKDRIEEVAGELIENIQRDDLMAMEIAEGMGVLLDEGLSRRQIAERLGKSPTYVTIMLSVRNMPPAVRKLYEEEIVIDPHTLYTLKQIHQEDAAFGEKVFAQAKRQGGLTRTKARELLASLKGGGGLDGNSTTPDPAAPTGKPQDKLSADAAKLSPVAQDGDGEPVPGASGAVNGQSGALNTGEDVLESPARRAVQDQQQVQSAAGVPQASDQTAVDADSAAAAQETNSAGAAAVVSGQSVQVRIRVEVAFPDGNTAAGTLLLDRVDQDVEFGWVKLDDVTDAVRTEVDNIRILEVRPA